MRPASACLGDVTGRRRLYPKTFAYTYTDEDGRDATEELPLFGDLVRAVELAVELDEARDQR